MKKYFVIITVALAMVMGCAGQPITIAPLNPFVPPTDAQPCNTYKDNNITAGIIFSQIKNPCAAQNILIQIATGGVIFEAYKKEQFNKWADEAIKYIQTAELSGRQLQLYVTQQVYKLNEKFGMLVFSVSGLINVFGTDAILTSDDIKLCMLSLQDLKKQVSAFPSTM